MKCRTNKNLKFLRETYENKHFIGAILEGSSRSGKTISSVDFIIYLGCTENNKIINIVRDTYNSFKTTLYLDFHKRLKDFGFSSPFEDSKEVASFKLFDNQINFIGADKPSKFEGAGADFWYFNEMLDIQKMMFDLAEQRCRVFWWGDYNPKAEKHWVYDRILKRSNVAYCHSTLIDNPYISAIEKQKLKSYEPTDFNILQGTADKFMWNVYGLGLRSASEETIFKEYEFFDNVPSAYDFKIYGLDFGYSNDETAVCEVIIDGHNLYITEILYEKGLTNPDIYERLKHLDKNCYIVADSAEPKSITELRILGLNIIPAIKGAGSINYGISKIKNYRMFLNNNSPNLITEIQNYKWQKEKDGTILNVPIGGQDHLNDSIRYSLSKFQR